MTEVTAVEAITSTPSRKPTNGETLITLVLDETGSMSSCLQPTISSVNEYMQSQRNADGVAKASLYTFSDIGNFSKSFTTMRSMNINQKMADARATKESVRTVFENVDIGEVGELTTENYKPDGMTNLYDAIGSTIRNIESQLAPLTEVPNVLVVIVTDGGENSSKEFTLEGIRNMVKEKEAEGWTFVYLGANQDAWSVGASFGLSKGQTMTYSTNAMADTMRNLSNATAVYRSARIGGSDLEGTVAKDFFGDNGGNA